MEFSSKLRNDFKSCMEISLQHLTAIRCILTVSHSMVRMSQSVFLSTVQERRTFMRPCLAEGLRHFQFPSPPYSLKNLRKIICPTWSNDQRFP